MSKFFRTLFERMTQLLYPTGYVCPVCNAEAFLNEKGLCTDCAPKIRQLGTIPAAEPLDGLYVNYPYDPILRPAMHRLKYKQQSWLAVFFMDGVTLPEEIAFDAIVPVPTHPLKEYFRTYNPPEALALALQKQYPDLPIRADLLKKTKLTRSQTALRAKDRARNVKDVYRASKEAKGLSILLIDDVTTTGSTLNACARALKAQGAACVYALCACKVVAGDEAIDEDLFIEQ